MRDPDWQITIPALIDLRRLVVHRSEQTWAYMCVPLINHGNLETFWDPQWPAHTYSILPSAEKGNTSDNLLLYKEAGYGPSSGIEPKLLTLICVFLDCRTNADSFMLQRWNYAFALESSEEPSQLAFQGLAARLPPPKAIDFHSMPRIW